LPSIGSSIFFWPVAFFAGLKLAIERGRLWMHESGTYVKLTPAGAELFG